MAMCARDKDSDSLRRLRSASDELYYCTRKLTFFFCLSDSEVDDVYNDLLHLDIW